MLGTEFPGNKNRVFQDSHHFDVVYVDVLTHVACPSFSTATRRPEQ